MTVDQSAQFHAVFSSLTLGFLSSDESRGARIIIKKKIKSKKRRKNKSSTKTGRTQKKCVSSSSDARASFLLLRLRTSLLAPPPAVALFPPTFGRSPSPRDSYRQFSPRVAVRAASLAAGGKSGGLFFCFSVFTG